MRCTLVWLKPVFTLKRRIESRGVHWIARRTAATAVTESRGHLLAGKPPPISSVSGAPASHPAPTPLPRLVVHSRTKHCGGIPPPHGPSAGRSKALYAKNWCAYQKERNFCNSTSEPIPDIAQNQMGDHSERHPYASL